MKKKNEENRLSEQLDKELNEQYFYGLQCILDDLDLDKREKNQKQGDVDWYGFTDLTIE